MFFKQLANPGRQLLLAYVMLTIGGLLIHLKVHPPAKSLFFWWASPINGFNLIAVPILLLRPTTASWGVLLNAFGVGIGTIGMGYFSILNFEAPLTIFNVLTKTTLADILILWVKVPLIWAIYISTSAHEAARETGG